MLMMMMMMVMIMIMMMVTDTEQPSERDDEPGEFEHRRDFDNKQQASSLSSDLL